MEKNMKKGTIAFLCTIIGSVVGSLGDSYLKSKIIHKNNERVNKFKSYYNILNQWIILTHEGKNIEEFFIKNDLQKIAIYGMGEIGNRLFEELKESNVTVKYSIDKNAGSTYSELEVHSLEDELDEVDAVIVTTAFVFDEVRDKLEGKLNCPIISIEDVVFEL